MKRDQDLREFVCSSELLGRHLPSDEFVTHTHTRGGPSSAGRSRSLVNGEKKNNKSSYVKQQLVVKHTTSDRDDEKQAYQIQFNHLLASTYSSLTQTHAHRERADKN